jgi:hypothetical protein
MLINELNNFYGVQPYHKIAQITTVQKNNNYNTGTKLAVIFDTTKPTLYKFVNGAWVLADELCTTLTSNQFEAPTTISALFINLTINNYVPDNYIGMGDGAFPPMYDGAFVYVCSKFADIQPIFGDIKKGELAVIGTNTYMLTTGQAFTPTNWIILKSKSLQVTDIINLDKTDVGLDQVDNVADLNKPISELTKAALDFKADLTGANFTGKVTTTKTLIDGIGDVRSIPIINNSNNRTLSVADNGTCISCTSGGLTIPANTFSAGNNLIVYNNASTTLTINCSDITAIIAGDSTVMQSMTLVANGVCSIIFINANHIIVSGNIA